MSAKSTPRADNSSRVASGTDCMLASVNAPGVVTVHSLNRHKVDISSCMKESDSCCSGSADCATDRDSTAMTGTPLAATGAMADAAGLATGSGFAAAACALGFG